MANSFAVSRNTLILGLCLPLAVLLGYLLAEPLDSASLAVLVLIGSVLLFPILLKHHHLLLVFSWNASITPYFIPGRPALWMLMAVVSLFFAVLVRTVNDKNRFQNVPSLTKPLFFLLAVVAVTALLTGGFGSQVFGSRNYGGKGYFVIAASVMGYFALSSQVVPRHRANLIVAAFFLAGTTAVMSNLIYMAGPKFWFLYELFPTNSAEDQMAAEGAIGNSLVRITGLVLFGQAIYGFLLARYGLRGLFELRRPWRLALLLTAVFFSMFGGYRSGLVMVALTLLVLFLVEGLWKTRVMLTAAGVGVVVMIGVVCFVDRMPMSVQRTLSFLPVDVDPIIKLAAQDSTDWRLEMWKTLWPEVPKYLFLGKGYSLDPQALYMLSDVATRGHADSYEWAAYSGDYHNGLLSLVIPFGLYGVVAFLWFLVAGVRVLHNNFKYGSPELRTVNGYLLAFFVARAIYFFLVFGAFYGELFYFTGTLGLSVALNHGVCRPQQDFDNPRIDSEN